MKSLLDPAARDEILSRLERLRPDSPRRWGRMTAEQMISHLADQLRMGLGEIPPGPPAGPLRFAPMRYLAIHVMPWPRGKVQAPAEAFTNAPTTWEADREALTHLIARFAEQDPEAAWPAHSSFGRMTSHDWGVLAYRHLDHHLRQFSC